MKSNKQPQTVKKDSPLQLELAKIIFGNVLLGLAYAKWMVPHAIIYGGVTSLSLVLSRVLHSDIAYLTNGLTIFLLLLCWLFLGHGSLLKSIVSSLSYLVCFTFFYRLPFSLVVSLPLDFLLACVVIALGYYFCLSVGASTVGVDVIALIIHKKRPQISLARAIRWLNFLILACGLLVYGVQSVLIGVLFSLLYSSLLDKMLRRGKNV